LARATQTPYAARPRTLGMEKNVITVLLFDLLVAVAVGIAAAAITAFIVANVVIGWFKRS
jgi:hypothetical protein